MFSLRLFLNVDRIYGYFYMDTVEQDLDPSL